MSTDAMNEPNNLSTDKPYILCPFCNCITADKEDFAAHLGSDHLNTTAGTTTPDRSKIEPIPPNGYTQNFKQIEWYLNSVATKLNEVITYLNEKQDENNSV